MVSGGLGGLGRCIIGWMVERGARSFLVLSRSGASSEAAQDFCLEMRKRSVRLLAPSCDISSENVVTEVMGKYAQIMPPIKGCIQSAMVLKVRLVIHSRFFAALNTFRTASSGI